MIVAVAATDATCAGRVGSSVPRKSEVGYPDLLGRFTGPDRVQSAERAVWTDRRKSESAFESVVGRGSR